MICVGLAGSALFSFNKGDDRNFQIAKNLDIFNAIFKELDMFYVDTIDPEKVIKYGIDAMNLVKSVEELIGKDLGIKEDDLDNQRFVDFLEV